VDDVEWKPAADKNGRHRHQHPVCSLLPDHLLPRLLTGTQVRLHHQRNLPGQHLLNPFQHKKLSYRRGTARRAVSVETVRNVAKRSSSCIL